MTQHLRELLDSAVWHVEPRETDPVPVVLRRVRAYRRRKVTAGALAVALLALGAAVSWPTITTMREVPTAHPISGPAPTPRLVDGQIVAGGIQIPVPAGWTVTNDVTECVQLVDHIVLIAGPNDFGCTTALIEIRARPARSVHAPSADLLTTYPPLTDPRIVTLAGGEPGLLTKATTSERYAPKPGASYHNQLWLPWSQLEIVLRIDGEAQRNFLKSIRSAPRPAGRLAIGMDPASAALIVPGGSLQEPLAHGDTIAALLALLQRQEAVRDARQTCATEEHETAVLIFGAPDYWVLQTEQSYTLIVITLAEGCHEAVSSEGGRVRLSPEALEELRRPFEIRVP